jgi:hydrogenase expression/formation protein HypE
LGAEAPRVIVRPNNGVDFGVIDLGEQVMALSTDPFYIARELGMARAAWFAVHILASDVAVSGIAPTHMAVDLNLPPEITDKELEEMWEAVHQECRALGISVVTGHTARYAGCSYPMVGGATVFGIGPREKLIIPKAEAGDAVIVTKGPAIEATGLMAAYFPQYLEKRYGAAARKESQDVYYQMSVVKDAGIAAAVGGVTAMHDATECGVLGGLYEIATHSRVGMAIDADAIPMPEAVRRACECFSLDPFISISEGTLLATARASRAPAIISALKRAGIEAAIAGEVVPLAQGITVRRDGQVRPLSHPGVDPFWQRFEEYLKKAHAG